MLSSRILSLQKCAKYPMNPVFRRAMSHNPGGIPGANLPFRKCIGNPNRMFVMCILYFGSGFWFTNLAFVYWMIKN